MGFNLGGALSGAIGGFAVGGPIGAVAGGAAGGFLGGGGGGGGGGMPSYDPQAALNYQKQLFNQASDESLNFAKKGTQANIANQELVMPGSAAQRLLAERDINQYITGQVPLDVQLNTQRAIAQSLGGGYNPFTHGGLAPNAFARNIGQTSLGLSQYGLSAAPIWQQLANQMVSRPEVALSAALNAGQQGLVVAENQYQAQANQYLTQQAQNQYQQNMLMQGLNTGVNQYSAGNQANYLGNLSGYANTSSSPFGSSFLSSLFSGGGYTPYK